MTERAFLILCTGNICRSPSAEGVLRHHLQEAGLGFGARDTGALGAEAAAGIGE